jgi:hypothetical protein
MSPLCPRAPFPASLATQELTGQSSSKGSFDLFAQQPPKPQLPFRLSCFREIALRTQCSKRTTAAQRALPGLRGSGSGRSAKGRKKNGTLRKRTASRKTSRMSRAFQPRASKNPTPAAGANFIGAAPKTLAELLDEFFRVPWSTPRGRVWRNVAGQSAARIGDSEDLAARQVLAGCISSMGGISRQHDAARMIQR